MEGRLSRLYADLGLLIGNVYFTAIFVEVYRQRAAFKSRADRLISFFTPPREQKTAHPTLWLFGVSFAALYLEIMLIRWVSTEVRVFAYFQNLALIACFLGFGIGCFYAQQRRSVVVSIFAMTALVTLVQSQEAFGLWKKFDNSVTSILSMSADAIMWGGVFRNEGPETRALLTWAAILVVICLLLLLMAVMIPPGQWVGYYLDIAPDPVSAYSANLLGSVAGIWVFAGLAFISLPPPYWFCVAFLLLVPIGRGRRRLVLLGLVLAGVCVLLLHLGGTPWVKTYWSPYQKLEVEDLGDQQYSISVNNTGYMSIANTTADFMARHPEIASRYRSYSSYDAPFRFVGKCDEVLIVGAGAGNDAAAALRNGAGEVDTVEIDPVIYSLGERLHPAQPYASPHVHKILNDARAFLRNTRKQYDLILFGLLDSHTQFSDFSNMRIDNYVYTEGSFQEARRLLKPSGIMVVKFEVRTPWTWVGQRFYTMLERAFGRPPIVFYAPRLDALSRATVFITSNGPGLWARAAQPDLVGLVAENPPPFSVATASAVVPATDDWPYVYHRDRSIPRTYLVVSLILLAMTILLVRGPMELRRVSTFQFFLLGAGFLLMETQLVSRLGLYFGTTWLVNCVALTAILCVLVVANAYVKFVRPHRLSPYYVLLVVSLLGNYFMPWERLPYGARSVGLALSAAYSTSLFFAGVLFTEMFRREERKSSAFGANLVGAVAGGLSQNISFLTGMKSLLLLAALFYGLAGLCQLLKLNPEAGVTPATLPSEP
jgi:SAM-dependent methyltransferase